MYLEITLKLKVCHSSDNTAKHIHLILRNQELSLLRILLELKPASE